MRPEAPEGHFLETLVANCAEFELDERLTFSGIVSRLDVMLVDAEIEDARPQQRRLSVLRRSEGGGFYHASDGTATVLGGGDDDEHGPQGGETGGSYSVQTL